MSNEARVISARKQRSSMTDSVSDQNGIAEGIAAWATTLAEMDASESDTDEKLEDLWRSIGSPAGAFAAAAVAIVTLPRPINESAAVRERAAPVRELLGVASAETQLSAMLTAREVLERLALRFG